MKNPIQTLTNLAMALLQVRSSLPEHEQEIEEIARRLSTCKPHALDLEKALDFIKKGLTVEAKEIFAEAQRLIELKNSYESLQHETLKNLQIFSQMLKKL